MLDFKKHKKKWIKAFPHLSEEELKYHFNLRVKFWEGIIDDVDKFKKN